MPLGSTPHFPTHVPNHSPGNFARTYMSNNTPHGTNQSQRIFSFYTYNPPTPPVLSTVSNPGPSNLQSSNMEHVGGFGLGTIINNNENEHNVGSQGADHPRSGNESRNGDSIRISQPPAFLGRASPSSGPAQGSHPSTENGNSATTDRNSNDNPGGTDSDTIMGNSDDGQNIHHQFLVAPLQLPLPPATTGANGPSTSAMVDNRVLPSPYHRFPTFTRPNGSQQGGQPEAQQVPPRPTSESEITPVPISTHHQPSSVIVSSQQHHSQPHPPPAPPSLPSYPSNQQLPRTQSLHSPVSASFHSASSQGLQVSAVEPFQQQLITGAAETTRHPIQSRKSPLQGFQYQVIQAIFSLNYLCPLAFQRPGEKERGTLFKVARLTQRLI